MSRDGGLNWTALTSPHRYITALVVDSSNSGQVYAGTLNGVYRSDDAGETWVRVSSGLYDLNIRALSLGNQPGWIAAATGDGVYRSYDHGETWQRRSDMLGPDYFTAVIAGEQPVAASWNGVFIGARDDYHWTTNPTGLLNRRITSLVHMEEVIIAGTYGGGVHILRQTCRPVYGLVTDTITGKPISARIVIEPGPFITYSDISGSYAFENLPPGQYTVKAKFSSGKRSDSVEVDLETNTSLRLDLNLPADLRANTWHLDVIAPPEWTNILRGEMVSLVLRAHLPEEFSTDNEIIWTSSIEGRLGASVLNESGVSRFDVQLHHTGLQTIKAELTSSDKVQGEAKIRLWVKEPVDLGAIGMALDGKYLWLTVELAEMGPGQIGNVYQLAVQDNNLEVVNKFPHPAPAPDSIAWDGQTFWTSGIEGPDPFRAWDEGTQYLYRHTTDTGLSVVARYPIAEGPEGVQVGGLTWDGQHLWAAANDDIVQLRNVDTYPSSGNRYQAPSSHLGAIEWVNDHLWVFDSVTDKLYKFKIDGSVLSLEGECAPGAIGSYGMAWDGAGFWLMSSGSPALGHYSLSANCPRP